MLSIKFTKKQLEKMADQTRLLSWAQGAIITSTSGFNFRVNFFTVSMIIVNFIALQVFSLYFDKGADK